MSELFRPYCIVLVLMSLAGFVLMGADKARAKANRWRVPEKLLFAVAILLGGPGSCLGMFFFRHKTQHWYFRLFFPLLAVLQLGLMVYLLLV